MLYYFHIFQIYFTRSFGFRNCFYLFEHANESVYTNGWFPRVCQVFSKHFLIEFLRRVASKIQSLCNFFSSSLIYFVAYTSFSVCVIHSDLLIACHMILIMVMHFKPTCNIVFVNFVFWPAAENVLLWMLTEAM